MNHTQMMGKCWRLINELGITEDKEQYETDKDNYYLVKNIHQVRDALYSDLENGIEKDESLEEFFIRHNIELIL